jgi:hypothetical protein
MATLTNTKVKDTYQYLLKLNSTLTSTLGVVEDGAGVDTGLHISTTGVGVDSLTFTTAPTTDNTVTDSLFVNGSNQVVKKRLGTSAFVDTVNLTAGSDILIGGTYPNLTITNSRPDQTVSITGDTYNVIGGNYPNFSITSPVNGTFQQFEGDTGVHAATSPNEKFVINGGTGISTLVENANQRVIINNDAPDQVVSITGTGATTVTGTYPNFTVDTDTGVHEEMFVGIPESPYQLDAGVPQIIAFSAADNTTENSSYHFGKAPAKLTTPQNTVVFNGSGSPRVVYIDMAAYVDVLSPNSDITYRLQTNTGTGWVSKQEARRTKGTTGLQVDSFWGIFIVADGEQLRIEIESQSGDIILTPMTQVKFQVKELGNII